MGKASRDKGANFERRVVHMFREYHFEAVRIPLSGAAEGFPGDVLVTVGWQEDPLRVECKKRADGFREIYRWLEGNDLLVIGADRKEPLAVMPLKLAVEIMQ